MTLNHLADALFSKSQQMVLGLMYRSPDRTFYTNEVLRLSTIGRGTVQRELKKLAQAGILKVVKQGNQLHYQANPECPIYPELLGIVRKTFGLADVVRQALQSVDAQIQLAFIYGSMVKGDDSVASDIDLLVITDSLAYTDLMAVLQVAEQSLGRAINPSIYTAAQLKDKWAQQNAFITRLMEQPKLWVKGGDHDLREVRKFSQD